MRSSGQPRHSTTAAPPTTAYLQVGLVSLCYVGYVLCDMVPLQLIVGLAGITLAHSALVVLCKK